MASVKEYLSKQETGTLEVLLTQETYGRDKYPLSTIYLICAILSEREPRRGSVREVFLRFCEAFADTKEYL